MLCRPTIPSFSELKPETHTHFFWPQSDKSAQIIDFVSDGSFCGLTCRTKAQCDADF